MSDNPYAPPAAKVADVETDRAMERPREVTLAVWLCWLSIVVALPAIVDGYIEFVVQETDRAASIGYIVINVMMYAIGIWVILALSRARRWARVAYVALALLGILGNISAWDQYQARPWYAGSTMFLSSFVDIAVVVLLFRPAANAWYRARGRRPANATT